MPDLFCGPSPPATVHTDSCAPFYLIHEVGASRKLVASHRIADDSYLLRGDTRFDELSILTVTIGSGRAGTLCQRVRIDPDSFTNAGLLGVAAPAVVVRSTDPASPNRVELDVAQARHQVSIGIDYTAFESARPKRANPRFEPIDSAPLPRRDATHQAGYCAPVGVWLQNKVHVIGHQTVSVYRHVVAGLPFDQVIQVILIIARLDKYRFMIVTSLYDVMRKAGNEHSRRPTHMELPVTQRFVPPEFL